MQGFKPRGFVAHQQREQKFADGGLVQRLKNLIGGDRKRQIDSAVDAAVNPTPKPAPQQEQKVPVSSSDGKFDEKRVNANNLAGIGFADGGRVRPRGFVVGPGTETSDSIPARLSAGEYVLPADTVEAVGVDQLDALREATHKPVKGEGAKAARGFFAGGTPGGLDEAYKNWQDKKTPWYMPTPAGNMEERTAEAAYTQALRNSYSGNSSPSATGQPGGPSRQAAPAPDAAPTQSAPQQSAFDASTAKDPTYGLAPTKVNAQPKTQPAEKPTPPANAPQEIEPGVYRHGRGQYSDSSTGMGFSPGRTGQPTEQNMKAADALDERSQQESMARLQARGFAPAERVQPQANYSANNGSDFTWMKDLRDPRNLAVRNASVAPTQFSSKEAEFKGERQRREKVALVQGLVQEQMKGAQQAATTRYQADSNLAGTQEQADASRYATDMRGETDRQRNAIDAYRANVDAQRTGLDAQAKGFDIRRAQRAEGILQQYDSAKTEAEQAALIKRYPDVFGQKGESWKGIALQGSTDAQGNKTEGVLAAVNERTGEMRRLDGGAGQAAPTSRPVGTTSTVNGKTAVWDGTKWVPRG